MPEDFHEHPRHPGAPVMDSPASARQMNVTRARYTTRAPDSTRVEHAGKETPAPQIAEITPTQRATAERSALLSPGAGIHRISYL
jgi:hypothetical protein